MITALRASKARVQVEVRMGTADDGSYVTTRVDLSRMDEAVKEAFAPIEELAVRLANERVGQATTRKLIEARARELSATRIAAANTRSQKTKQKTVERVLEIVKQRLAWRSDEPYRDALLGVQREVQKLSDDKEAVA